MSLKYYMPFDQSDLTPAFRNEPVVNLRTGNMRFYADDRNYMWRPGLMTIMAYVKEIILLEHWAELEKLQRDSAS